MTRHHFDPFSLAAGVIFVGLGVAGASGALTDFERLRVTWPLLLVVIGGLLVASTIRPRSAAAASLAAATAFDESGPGGRDSSFGADESASDEID